MRSAEQERVGMLCDGNCADSFVPLWHLPEVSPVVSDGSTLLKRIGKLVEGGFMSFTP